LARPSSQLRDEVFKNQVDHACHVPGYFTPFPRTMAYLQDDPPLPPLSSVFPQLEDDGAAFPASADPFTVTTNTGFLPSRPPLTTLPDDFEPLTNLLDAMPIVKADGRPGLLAEFKLGPLIDTGALPDLSAKIDHLVGPDGKPDLAVITAVFRDYSFLASAYLLEPCWESWSKDHSAGYGLGRQMLPKCIASPLVMTADM